MDYLLVSDAHGDIGILRQLFSTYRGKVTAMFYAGDSELLARDSVFNDVQTVGGNMDYDPAFSEDVLYVDDLSRIFMAHGHLYDTNYTLDALLAAGQKRDADFIVTGHTHQLGVEWFGNTLVINPGSISAPRGQYRDIGGTYAILSVTEKDIKVTFFDRQMNPVPNLSFVWQK